IYWNPKTREVTVELDGNTILLTIGKNTALVNGIKTKIDPNNSKVVPVIINGRTYLPLRFIAEHLNCTVDWDPVTKSITIYYYG
ncbi:MAG: copper amine oxidase N-terminal domain-containing protein, partial [Caldisericaceae bacterium]|nr:copper amine oxidase N-terminal domain-containing protein [Caldisericaceae bacterium]